jgi:hypothetical protein
MGVLTAGKGLADHAHGQLAQAIQVGLASPHAMTGSLQITNQAKHVLHSVTANYNGVRHVEPQLLQAVFDWARACTPNTQFVLPANTRVYLYVYDSPCPACVQTMRICVKNWRDNNPSSTWKLGFTRWYLGGPLPEITRYTDQLTATQAYNGLQNHSGMSWEIKL